MWGLGGEGSVEAQARAAAQDLEDVLNPTFVPDPHDLDAVGVFAAKNQYLFSVFVTKLTTDEGKALVRKHAAKFDAQAIYKGLCDFHATSMHAQLESNTKLSWLTSVKIGRDRFPGKTAVSFVAYYVEQLRLYDELKLTTGAPSTDDDFKISSLDRAVETIPKLVARRYGGCRSRST